MNETIWSEEAKEAFKVRPRNWYFYYTQKSYINAINKGLSNLSKKEEIKILKTDLWNECIESK